MKYLMSICGGMLSRSGRRIIGNAFAVFGGYTVKRGQDYDPLLRIWIDSLQHRRSRNIEFLSGSVAEPFRIIHAMFSLAMTTTSLEFCNREFTSRGLLLFAISWGREMIHVITHLARFPLFQCLGRQAKNRKMTTGF